MKIIVHSVGSALNPNGEIRIGVAFTTDCLLPPKITEKKPGATTIQIIPGIQTPLPQSPRENRATFFFTEEEWKKLKKKPNVGDEYTLSFGDDNSIILKP